MMIQSNITVERPRQDDEDSLFDSWLASLSPREFELILDGLAEPEISATQKVSA
jgi:hypothetical protein